LRKDVQRIVVALEKLAGIESQNSKEERVLWPESKREETEIQESKEKEKQRSEEEVRGQEEENRMEGVKEGSSSFSLVTLMGIKRFDYKTKVKARSERQNLQTASQLCTKQVGTGKINKIIESLLKVNIKRIAKIYLIET